MSLDQQQQQARNLIAQMVANSDLRGEDEAEQRRVAGDEDEDGGDDEQQQQQYDDDGVSEAAADELPQHKDQVQSAFENYGQITEEILAEWKEMFSLFDFDNTGFIKTDDLGTVLRGLGRNLTEAVIGTFINSYDANGSGKIDFPTFYRSVLTRHDKLDADGGVRTPLSHSCVHWLTFRLSVAHFLCTSV